MLRWLLAWVHLLGFAIALGAVWARGRALRGTLDPERLRTAFYADNLWGIATLLSIATGVFRAFGGIEKGSAYYLQNHLFQTKLTIYLVIFALELWPMVTLIRWRRLIRRGQTLDTRPAAAFARISTIEALLLVVMALLAAGVARGFGIPDTV